MRRRNILLGVSRSAALELILILGGGVGLVFRLRILTIERRGTAILLEELGGRLVTADLHNSELVPLPLCSNSLALKSIL